MVDDPTKRPCPKCKSDKVRTYTHPRGLSFGCYVQCDRCVTVVRDYTIDNYTSKRKG